MNVSEELKGQAIGLGLCQQWQSEWDNADKDELLEKYVRGIDFCIEHNYPSLEYMTRNFDGVMQEHGVFVSEEISLYNPFMTIANGKCTGKVTFGKYGTGRMYIRHDSEIDLIVSGNAKVFVSIYDNAKLNIICTGEAKVYVYKKGGSVTFEGNVLVRE